MDENSESDEGRDAERLHDTLNRTNMQKKISNRFDDQGRSG